MSTLSYENIVQDVALMKHFIGLKPSQFEVLNDFLDDVKSFFKLNCLFAEINVQRLLRKENLKIKRMYLAAILFFFIPWREVM